MEVRYKDLPNKQFYFKIKKAKSTDPRATGKTVEKTVQYTVEIANDKRNEKVVLTKINANSKHLVGAYVNAGNEPYVQAGAITQAVTSEPGSSEKGYKITTEEKYINPGLYRVGGDFYNGSVSTGKYILDFTQRSNIKNDMFVINDTSKGYDRIRYGSVNKYEQKNYTLKNAIVNGEIVPITHVPAT